MATPYSTDQLIDILAAERLACLNGQRLNLTAAAGNPLIDRFLRTEGMQKFTAYQDFRAAVHEYQREHQVSGIVWRQVTVKQYSLRYPEVHDQLIALPVDLLTLQAAKLSIVDFWHQATSGMDLYLAVDRGKQHQPIQPADVDYTAQRVDWATLTKYENPERQVGDAAYLEVVLQLGWGLPEEAHYHRSWPESGSEYVHAVNPGTCPLVC